VSQGLPSFRAFQVISAVDHGKAVRWAYCAHAMKRAVILAAMANTFVGARAS
jgi:hypothetical protein